MALFLVFGMVTADSRAKAAGGAGDLQAVIDRAPPGSTVRIPPGTYAGPISIQKPVTIVGGPGVRIVNGPAERTDQPLLLVETDKAHIAGLQLEDRISDSKHATVEIHGDDNELSEMTISTGSIGIRFRSADRNRFTAVRIQGTGTSRPGASVFTVGNGIELWNSDNNWIQNSYITNVQDGVYLDSSRGNHVLNNTVLDSHYAVHLMFTGGIEVAGNHFSRNVTGVMVMGDEGSRIIGNHIDKQSANVQAQGVMVYDSRHCLVAQNRVEGNRIGLYVDKSTQNRFVDNVILQNFLGLQVTSSSDNDFHRNLWLGNVVQAQAVASRDNRMDGNYWDDLQGLDIDGDGHSELPYRVSPFLLSLTRAVPAYQVFFQAPGTFILEQMFTSGTRQWLTDTSPLMKPPDDQPTSAPPDKNVPVVSLFLLGLGLYPFFHHRAGA